MRRRWHVGACRTSFGASLDDDLIAAHGALCRSLALAAVHKVAMVVAMDEPKVRFPKTVWARRHLPAMPEAVGIDISSIHSDYNHSLGGADRHDAGLAIQQEIYADDVIR